LSGFIITWTQYKHLGNRRSIPSYLSRRLWRIYSLFWVCFGLATIVHVACEGSSGAATPTGWQWTRQLFLWPWNQGTPYVPVAWSLTYEVMFYVEFVVFLILPARWFPAALATWSGLVIARHVLWTPTGPSWSPIAPVTLEFLAGCWTALICRCFSGLEKTVLGIGCCAFASSVACLSLWQPVVGPWQPVLLGPSAGLVIYGLVGLERAGAMRPPTWLCRLGDASYSIYLTHWTIAIVLLVATRGWPHTPLGHAAWIALMLVVMIGGGYLCYLGVERPLLQLVKPRKPAVRLGPERPSSLPPARAA
jgi:peptidoglycan/LPS O-acetylase OafA/YrhL